MWYVSKYHKYSIGSFTLKKHFIIHVCTKLVSINFWRHINITTNNYWVSQYRKKYFC